MKMLLKWILNALALMALCQLDSGLWLNGFGAALLAAFVIGFFNMLVRPVLVVLTLPITLLSLGLFLFIINALMFWWASALIQGFEIAHFSDALLGSLLYSLWGVVLNSALE
jgi:putative membrane protein